MNNAVVTNKKASKIKKFYVLQIAFLLNFVGIVSVSLSYNSIALSHVIAKSFIILAKYFPLLQLHVEGFQI